MENACVVQQRVGRALIDCVARYDTDKAVRQQFWEYVLEHNPYEQRGLYRILLSGPLHEWVGPWLFRERVACILRYVADISSCLSKADTNANDRRPADKDFHMVWQEWRALPALRVCMRQLSVGCRNVLLWANVGHLSSLFRLIMEQETHGIRHADVWTFPIRFGDGHVQLPTEEAYRQLIAVEGFSRKNAVTLFANECTPCMERMLGSSSIAEVFLPSTEGLNVLMMDRRALYAGPPGEWEEFTPSRNVVMEVLRGWFRAYYPGKL